MVLTAGAVVVAFAAFLLGLGVLIFAQRPLAERFLSAFACSAGAHYLEQFLRLLVGGALLVYAPYMHWTGVFKLFGWLVVGTTIGLLCIPWRWHQRFAGKVVPFVIRYAGVYGIASAALGALVLYSVIVAATAS